MNITSVAWLGSDVEQVCMLGGMPVNSLLWPDVFLPAVEWIWAPRRVRSGEVQA